MSYLPDSIRDGSYDAIIAKRNQDTFNEFRKRIKELEEMVDERDEVIHQLEKQICFGGV